MKKFSDMITSHGWQARIVPIDHLTDLYHAIHDRHEQGLFDETLYQEQYGFFSFDPPANLEIRSIIVVAVPTPQMRLQLHWQGKIVPVIIPPTYVSYTPRTESVQAVLSDWLIQKGFSLEKTKLPLKTLAVRSGLAEYGRNNICYVPGMGSFLQLVGAFSDIPSKTDPWRVPKALDRCESCMACLRTCPTSAISNDRFLLHAEFCLTFHNESARDFPDWIDPSWHHCLFGCMRCQIICPENKAVKDWFEDRGEFSEQETDLFMRCVPFEQLPEETAVKWKSMQINEDYRLICRNLAMLVR